MNYNFATHNEYLISNFQGLDHRKTVYDQSLLYVGSVDRDQSKEDKIWK